MGNSVVFRKAFTECGIGGRFSKFQIIQKGDWFELIDVAKIEDAHFCFKVYDRFDYKSLKLITLKAAHQLHDDPKWVSSVNTANLVVTKIVSKGTQRVDTRFYVDHVKQSVVLVNRMFVIEVMPTLQPLYSIPSSDAYSWLHAHGGKPNIEDDIFVFSKMGNVLICHNDNEYVTNLTYTEFNSLFEAA